MSDTDIRGFGETPAQAKTPHAIYFKGEKIKTFPNYKAAYLYGIARWGSASLNDLYRDNYDEEQIPTFDGWTIWREKR